MPTENINHEISLTEASEYTAAFRAAYPNEVLGFAIPVQIYKDIINQEGCVYVRTYNAVDAHGNKEIVVVGVDKDFNDLYDGVLGNRSIKNPPYSGATNALNS